MQIEHLNGLSPVWVFQCLNNVDRGHKRSKQDQRSRWAPLQQPILGKAHPTVLARISLVQPLFRHPVNNRHNYPSKSRQKVDCPTHDKYVRAQQGNWQVGASTSQELPVFYRYVSFSCLFTSTSQERAVQGSPGSSHLPSHPPLGTGPPAQQASIPFIKNRFNMNEHILHISSCFRQVQNP